VSREGIEPSTT